MILEIGLGLLALLALLALVFGWTQRAASLRARGAQAQAEAQARALREAVAQSEERGRLAEGTLASTLLHEQALRADLARAEGALASLQEERQSLVSAAGQRAEELRRAREAGARATESLHAMRLEKRALEQDGARRDAELSQLRAAQSQDRSEQARLLHQVEELHSANEALRGEQVEQARLTQEIDGLRAELEAARADQQAGPSRTFFARMKALDEQVVALSGDLERWARRAQSAEAELASREDGAAERGLVLERDALRSRVGALESSLERVAVSRATLRVLGVPAAPDSAQFFSPERRERTEAVMRDTYIAAQAAGAAIFDAGGVAWARFGNPPVVERLAATAALLGAMPVRAALGRPAQLLSELYGVHGRHAVRLAGSELLLTLTGSRECPALALRLAALQLVGFTPLEVRDSADAEVLDLHPERSDRLGAWAVRRGVVAAAVLGQGEPASTDSSFAGACAPLLGQVMGLYRRSHRDGFSVGYTLIWRGQDDVSLVAQVVDEGASVAFAKFNAPPAPRALDDLAATARWLGADLARAS